MRFITVLLLMVWLAGMAILIGSIAYPNNLVSCAQWANDNFQTRFALDPTVYLPYAYATSGVPLLLVCIIFRSTTTRQRLRQHIAQLKAEHDLITFQLTAYLPIIEKKLIAQEVALNKGDLEDAEKQVRAQLEEINERQRALSNRVGQLNVGAHSLASLLARVSEADKAIASALNAIDPDGDKLEVKIKGFLDASQSQAERLGALEFLPDQLKKIKDTLTALEKRAKKLDGNNELTNFYNEVYDLDTKVEKEVKNIESFDDDGDFQHYVDNLAENVQKFTERLDALDPLPDRLTVIKQRLTSCHEQVDALDIKATLKAIDELKTDVDNKLEGMETDDNGDDIAKVVENLENDFKKLKQRLDRLNTVWSRLNQFVATVGGSTNGS